MTESWVPGADGSGFGLDNLPFGVVQPAGEPPRVAVRIGGQALLLQPLADAGLLGGIPRDTFAGPVLNPFLALGRPAWTDTRARLQELLAEGAPSTERTAAALVALEEAEPRLPVQIGDYVDFYSSIEHATNVGRIFRPDAEPLKPNWRHLPVGYHGRAASVVVSGTPIVRPSGQLPQSGGTPRFGPTERLDVELELGFVTARATPSAPRSRPARRASGSSASCSSTTGAHATSSAGSTSRSARSSASRSRPRSRRGSCRWTRSSPYRVPSPAQDPEPLPYLRTDEDWGLDVALEIALEIDGRESVVSRTNARGLYWTAPQQLAHATVNGANARPGDLFASGTISGPAPGTYGSLLELTWGGRLELDLPGGVSRAFLEDGDTVTMRGRAGSVSFGEVTGTVLPA